jgi:hypothetical protein
MTSARKKYRDASYAFGQKCAVGVRTFGGSFSKNPAKAGTPAAPFLPRADYPHYRDIGRQIVRSDP